MVLQAFVWDGHRDRSVANSLYSPQCNYQILHSNLPEKAAVSSQSLEVTSTGSHKNAWNSRKDSLEFASFSFCLNSDVCIIFKRIRVTSITLRI